MLNFSNRTELRFLADLVAQFQTAAPEVPFLIAGATARDLLLLYGYGIQTGRKTRDVDLALVVQDWNEFSTIRARLLDTGRFTGKDRTPHKLIFQERMEIDLVPFGQIERDDRTIAWPPQGEPVMNVFGFREVFESALPVQLPDGARANIVSLPALSILKIVAWRDRRIREPGKDAEDLGLILARYIDAGNHERLYREAAHLLEDPAFDLQEAGAWLLGIDMARLLAAERRAVVANILAEETKAEGSLRLASDMPETPARNLALLQALWRGFLAGRES